MELEESWEKWLLLQLYKFQSTLCISINAGLQSMHPKKMGIWVGTMWVQEQHNQINIFLLYSIWDNIHPWGDQHNSLIQLKCLKWINAKAISINIKLYFQLEYCRNNVATCCTLSGLLYISGYNISPWKCQISLGFKMMVSTMGDDSLFLE